MKRSLSEGLIKGIEYLSLPFQYPNRFGDLLGKVLTARALVHELPRLTPHRAWLRSAGIRTVIDVGGFIGSFSYAIRTILPAVQIYSFEPLEDNYSRLVSNLSPLGNFQAYQTALGDHSGMIEFNRSDFTASSSVLEMAELHRKAFPQTAHQVKVTVPLAALDDYLDRLKLKQRIFLKVDVQGYELNVLKGCSRLLPQVDFLLTEISYRPLYTGQALFGEIYSMLTSLGFHFAGNFDSMFSPLDGSILQSDALFARQGNA